MYLDELLFEGLRVDAVRHFENLSGTASHVHVDPGVDMDVACSPTEVFEVPDGVDPQAFKEELIKVHCGPEMDRRDRFIEDMSRWLVQTTVTG